MTNDHRRGTQRKAHKIRNATRDENEASKPLGSRIRTRFALIGLDDGLPELRGESTRPATFEA